MGLILMNNEERALEFEQETGYKPETLSLADKQIENIVEDSRGKLTYTTAIKIVDKLTEFSSVVTYHKGHGSVYITKDINLPFGLSLKRGQLGTANNQPNQLIDVYAWFENMGFNGQNIKTIVKDVISRGVPDSQQITYYDDLKDDVKTHGNYKANIYRHIMVDWLGAKDEEYTYTWLKLLLWSIHTNQSYNGSYERYKARPYQFVIQGVQGVGKSAFVQGISNGHNFTYTPDVPERDLGLAMSGQLVIDMDDMAASGKKNSVDTLKQKITQSVVRRRKMREDDTIEELNRAVWIGSTNRSNIFKDTTGNRRSFPINVGTDMTKDNSNIMGREKYTKYFYENMFYDLWFTFYRDLENGLIPDGYNYDGESEVSRLSYINDYSAPVESLDGLSDILDLEVPTDLNTSKNYEKNDIIDYLTDGEYNRGDKNNIILQIENKETTSLGELEYIQASILNKAVKTITRFGNAGDVKDMMNDLGYKYDTNGARKYIKR